MHIRFKKYHTYELNYAVIKTQTVEILRLFWHSRNISFEVFRNAILTADVAKYFGFWAGGMDVHSLPVVDFEVYARSYRLRT